MRIRGSKLGAVCCIALLAGCVSETITDWDSVYSDPTAYQGIVETIPRSSIVRVDYALDRIAKIDHGGPNLQSVLTINPDAMEIAKALDAEGTKRSPLHGVPVLLKDNIETKDMPTTAGSYTLAANNTERDSPLTANLREAGAVILGKANLSQWANFRSEDSTSGWSALGAQTKNPHALNRSPCGSSSGSGAAVAAGIVPAAVGTETNGSVICPAAMNGIVGFKPTVGVISQDGIVPISSSQDTAGPMTLSVEDAAIMMDAMTGAGSDYRDAVLAGDLSGKRIGVLNFARGSNEGVNEVFDGVLETLVAQGAVLVEIEDYNPPEGFGEAAYDVLKYEFKATLNEYLTNAAPEVQSRTLADVIAETQSIPAEVAVFDQSIMDASNALGDLTTPDYLEALSLVHAATRDNGIDKMITENDLDVLVAPSAAPTFLIDHIYGDSYPGGTGAGWIAAIAGYPHITVPMGSVKGLPVGVSFMGQSGTDKSVMAIGYAYEKSSQKRVTPKFIPAVETLPNSGTLSRD